MRAAGLDLLVKYDGRGTSIHAAELQVLHRVVLSRLLYDKATYLIMFISEILQLGQKKLDSLSIRKVKLPITTV